MTARGAVGPGRWALVSGLPPLASVIAQHIMAALRLTKGNQTDAARVLGISRWALNRKLKKYTINPKELA